MKNNTRVVTQILAKPIFRLLCVCIRFGESLDYIRIPNYEFSFFCMYEMSWLRYRGLLKFERFVKLVNGLHV